MYHAHSQEPLHVPWNVQVTRNITNVVAGLKNLRFIRRKKRLATWIVAVNFYDCCEETLRAASQGTKEALDRLIEAAGFGLMGSSIGAPDQQSGFSYGANLMESGLQVHTWPGQDDGNCTQVVLHYCNYTQDNAGKAAKLLVSLQEFFRPKLVEEHAPYAFPL